MSQTANGRTAAAENLVVEFGSRESKPAPFERSIRAIMEAVAGHEGADAAFLYEYSAEEHRLSLLRRTGLFEDRTTTARVELPARTATWLNELTAPVFIEGATQNEKVASFPEVFLHGFDGLAIIPIETIPIESGKPAKSFLNIGWRRLPVDRNLEAASSLAQGLAHLLSRVNQSQEIRKLVLHLTALQSQLADCKIAERLEGMATPETDGPVSAGTIRDHILRVLDGADPAGDLLERLEKLQSELDGREVIARAKAILQTKRGMTEQQAYLHLQRTSRRRRQPLAAIAQEIAHFVMGEADAVTQRRTA